MSKYGKLGKAVKGAWETAENTTGATAGAMRRNPGKTAAGAGLVGAGYMAAQTEEEEMQAKKPTSLSEELYGSDSATPKRLPSAESLAEKTASMMAIPPEAELTPEQKEERETAVAARDLALEEYKRTESAEKKAAIIEGLGHAMARIGAALVGQQKGVDVVSGLDLKPTDWRQRRREDQADLERRQALMDRRIERVDADLERRQQQRQAQLNRRESAIISSMRGDWAEKNQRERQNIQQEERFKVDKLKQKAAQAKEVQKAVDAVDLASEYKRQAIDASGKKKDELLNKARETLIKGGISPDTIRQHFDKLDKPNFIMRFFGAEEEWEARGPEDISLEELRESLLGGPQQRQLSAKDQEALNWAQQNPDNPKARIILQSLGIKVED